MTIIYSNLRLGSQNKKSLGDQRPWKGIDVFSLEGVDNILPIDICIKEDRNKSIIYRAIFSGINLSGDADDVKSMQS